MIRAAVFDADGTLLNSMPIWRDAGGRFLGTIGVEPEPRLADILFPMSFEEGAEYLKSRYGLREEVSEIRSGVSRLIDGFYRQEVQLKAGAAEFLEKLSKMGVPMAIATTGDPALIGAALARLGVERHFRRVFTCERLGVTKRQPDIYLAAASYLGAQPEETAVFEDVLHALRAAKSAGFFTVAVEDGESAGDREAIEAQADLYMTDFLDFDTFWNAAAGI